MGEMNCGETKPRQGVMRDTKITDYITTLVEPPPQVADTILEPPVGLTKQVKWKETKILNFF